MIPVTGSKQLRNKRDLRGRYFFGVVVIWVFSGRFVSEKLSGKIVGQHSPLENEVSKIY